MLLAGMYLVTAWSLHRLQPAVLLRLPCTGIKIGWHQNCCADDAWQEQQQQQQLRMTDLKLQGR